MQPMALDTNANGIPDGAEKYPAFLATLFHTKDSSGNVIKATPRAQKRWRQNRSARCQKK